MTAPNKMAKRAAAGTLALAVCLGGGVLGSGAANAADLATATGTAAIAGTSTALVPGASGQAVAGASVALTDVEWKAGDRLLFTLPAGYTFSAVPTVTVAETVAGTGATAAPTFTTAYLDDATNTTDAEPQQVAVQFTNAFAGTIASSDYTFTLSNVKVTSPAGAASGAVQLTTYKQALTNASTGTYAARAGIGAAFTIGTSNSVTVSLASGQNLLAGSSTAKKLSPITITEVGNAGLADGIYTLTFGGGALIADVDPAGTADDVTITSSNSGATITGIARAGGNTALTFTVAGGSASASDSLTISGVRLTDPSAGPTTVTLTGNGATGVSGGVLAANTVASYTEPTRLGGLDRYQTASDVALAFDAGDNTANTNTVIVTNGGMGSASGISIDALSGAYLAGFQESLGGAPIVLTDGSSLPLAAETAIKSVVGTTGNVIILGGTAAVSADVEKAIKALEPAANAYTVTRITGADRYDTAARAAIAGTSAAAPVDNYTDTATGSVALKTAILASGTSPADALAAGQIAFDDRHPVLLTERDRVPQVTLDAMAVMGVKQVIIVGGTSVVSAAVEAQLTAAGIKPLRIAGADRFETSAALFKAAIDTRSGGIGAALTAGPALHLANGYALADASVAAPLAAKTDQGLLFTDKASLSASTATALKDAPAAVTGVVGIGLGTVLPEDTLVAANIAVNS